MSEEVKASRKTTFSTGSSCGQTPSRGRHPYPQGFPGGSDPKESACNAGYLCWEDPLENHTATHSSILAWRISWTEKPGGLQSMGSQRVGHDWVTSLSFFHLQTKKYMVLLMRNCEEVKLVFKYWDLNTLKFNHILNSKSSFEIVPEINYMKDFFLINVKILFTCFSQYGFEI